MRLLSVFLFVQILLFSACQRHSRHEIIDSSGIDSNKELIQYLSKLIDDEKANEQIYFKRARAYHNLGDNRMALLDIQKALELAPTDPALYLLQSTIYNAQSKSNESINAALQAEQRGLQNYALYRLLAINYLKQDEPENAKKAIERLLSFNYGPETLCLKGDVYLQLSDTLEAIKSYRGAIQEDKTASRAYLGLYELFLNDQPAIAEQFVDQYLALDNENSEFNRLKAKLLTRRNSYDSALAYYGILALDSNNVEDLAEIGNVYYFNANYDTALILASRTLEIDSNYFDGALLAARSLDRIQKYSDSKVIYQRLLAADSTNIIVKEELDKLNRKVAYLWRLQRQEQELDSIRRSVPPAVQRKDLNQ